MNHEAICTETALCLSRTGHSPICTCAIDPDACAVCRESYCDGECEAKACTCGAWAAHTWPHAMECGVFGAGVSE